MSKRPTHKSNRLTRSQMLEVRVMSPRVAWFSLLNLFGFFAKLAFTLAVVAGIGWGVWRGIERALYQNPDFRLQVIDLNPNSAIDEYGVVDVAGIDLTASLFEIHVDEVAAKLSAQPAILKATAERHLPGKLLVRVTPRTPQAWISCSSQLTETRRVGALLVDRTGVAYPCPEIQFESAQNLPIICLRVSAENPIQAGKKIEIPELAHCVRLLDSASAADSESIQWIDSVKQVNAWSLELTTRQGTTATFALGDHSRQMYSLRAALDHAQQKGYDIDTINLIPKHNIPITTRMLASVPREIIAEEPRVNRRDRDLEILLNRN